MELNKDEIIDQVKSQIDFSKFISCSKVLLPVECAQFCLNLALTNKDLSEECCNLLAKARKLSEENERLGIDNFNLICELSRIKDDTVRKMQKLINERLDISANGYSTEEVRQMVFDTVDRIVEELLEDTDAHQMEQTE